MKVRLRKVYHACFGGVLVLAGLVAGCRERATAEGSTVGEIPAKELPGGEVARADVAHGKELVGTYQCNRCHEGTGQPPAPEGKNCVQCHANIIAGTFKAEAATLAKWRPRVKDLTDAPTLTAAGRRWSQPWLERYLLEPTDLRPHLAQYMPRLAISASDARDMAAYLTADAPAQEPALDLASADLANGRHVLDTKGCGSCHVFGGVAPLENSPPPPLDGNAWLRSRRLAPDLRVTRERMTAARLVRWLEDPSAVKPDAAMPKIALSAKEIKDLAAYILSAELAPRAAVATFARLPLLTRKVTFKEVDEKVFHRTCWHCHSEPDYAIGDGGPGNSGGFGFKPRGLNLSDYGGIAAGFIDDKGQRSSIFAAEPDGTSRLVAALVARHDEEASGNTGPVRGMPLGYAPLSAEDIQLVESWVAQGRPR